MVRAFTVGVAAAGLALAALAAEPAALERRAAVAMTYDDLLHEYVTVVSKPGQPLLTRFDYARLHTAKDRTQTLAAVRKQLLSSLTKATTPGDSIAWAINTYNFLVIEAVASHLDVFEGPGASVMKITIGDQPFFDAPLVEIDGATYSLNTFERHFVFGDFDRNSGKTPPARVDPRAHFALVCAANGCPPLRPRSYAGDSLDAQLDAITRESLASPVHLRWNPKNGRVAASSVFDWYAGDFGGAPAALVFLERYAPQGVRRGLAEAGHIERFIAWDWTLNQTSRR